MFSMLIIYLLLGLLTAVLSVPLIAQKIKPNIFYGFRVPKTIKNPGIWYKANRYAGIRLLIASIALIITALVLYWVPGMNVVIYQSACILVFIVIFGIGIIQSFIYLRSL